MTLDLNAAQLDRAAGVLLGMACGDALGAPYEFGPPLGADVRVRMAGGGSFGWSPGEWTDDTSMAIAIAEVSAQGRDLLSPQAQDLVAARWSDWAKSAKDVGHQTRSVLGAARQAAAHRGLDHPNAGDLARASETYHARTGRSGGNGSLMRTAPVALAFLDDEAGLVEAAQQLSALTHFDPEAGEACALWCLAIRHAVLHGKLDGLRLALDHLPTDRALVWSQRLDEAEARMPGDFERNGWVVEALQGAWSAITHSRNAAGGAAEHTSTSAEHLRTGLEAAVRGGRDADTVAAIAGGLLGGAYGASAVPAAWRRKLHGWPGLRARDLLSFGVMTARGGQPDVDGWPQAGRMDYSGYPGRFAMVQHPDDDGVWLGGVDALEHLPAGVNAVVSLCRLGAAEVPAQGAAVGDHVEVWLVDDSRPGKNSHLDFVLADAAATVDALRKEGKTVLLHCVQAQSRTPAVAGLYAARFKGRTLTEALADIQKVLPDADPNRGLRAALERLT
jgi:ADP-ribosyl-[dinitrogen reductase] hydrolase